MDAKVFLFAVVLSAGFIPGTSFADQSALSQMLAKDSDVAICNKVRNALEAERNLHFVDIRVTTIRGRVQLSGYVQSKRDLLKAEQVAQKIRGVVLVRNDLLLKGEIRA